MQRPIRVLAALIVPPHLTASGGARAGRALSEALAGAGCSVRIASMGASLEGLAAGGSRVRDEVVRTSLPVVARVLPRGLRSLFYRSDIPETVAAGEWDLVHLHNPMPALEMARIARRCRRVGVPYVVSTHGFNEVARGGQIYGFGWMRRLAWRLLMERPVRRVVQGAAAVFALSPADIEIVRGFGFEGPITIVPNGVTPVEGDGDAGDRTVWRKFGVLPPEQAPGLTCMFLGNHTPNKGVPVLLEAFAGLGCPFQLIVGGERRSGIDYDGARAQIGPRQSIIVTGRLTDAEVGALLRRTDLFVFPTLADTFPLVVLEAMAQGCAVLASDVGGIPYQVQNGSGELVRPGDVHALREAITRLAGQPAVVTAMKAAAVTDVRARFTWAAAAALARDGYQEVLEPGRLVEEARLGSRPAALVGAAARS